jgi:hypothetical protein
MMGVLLRVFREKPENQGPAANPIAPLARPLVSS